MNGEWGVENREWMIY
ncbi:MAG: hypothetical protein DCC59_07890 [Chloroflexi bacterium]|nr:hypothetical protein [Chloroflexota bacterium]MDL1918997.1 hypothetical protein [Chloroflexi bacterium CFX5]NUQ60414.1 hypothetical protein [Anaerolineales bacterium]RIK53208.1 MAG: hypothetical protein DCC59_07890 [Chloroflexota bacterium]